MNLLTSSDYPAIRAAIDISLDPEVLPDSIIDHPIYAPWADAEVCRRDPAWAGRDAAGQQKLVNAAIFLTAAVLAPAIPQVIQEQTTEHSYSRRSVDWSRLADELRARAEQEIAAVVETSAAIDRPTMFSVGTGRRGQ